MNKSALLQKIWQATWSIREAAYIVHGKHPDQCPEKISPTSHNDYSKTFYWLKKEIKKGKIVPVDEFEREPVFSPGTLIRHLKKSNHYVSKYVQDNYDKSHSKEYSKQANAEAKALCIKSADLIWKQYPELPKSRVARILSENLPPHLGDYSVAHIPPERIRGWLKGKGPQKIGHPTKLASPDSIEIDIGALVKKLAG